MEGRAPAAGHDTTSGIPGIPGISGDSGDSQGLGGTCSKKLVLEQHSFTFADFCCPVTPLPGMRRIPGACAKSTANTKEAAFGRLRKGGAAEGRPPFVVSFVLAVNTGHILVLRRKTCALLRA